MVIVPPPHVTLHGPQSIKIFQSLSSLAPSSYFPDFFLFFISKTESLSAKGDLMTADVD
jgi:hypothetical protein